MRIFSLRLLLPLLSLFLLPLPAAWAGYEGTELDLKITEVVPGVYSAIGETRPPSFENSGHNNNLSFIVTSGGVVVVNGGANNLLARSLHKAIKARTDQPVKLVINENGQGHAFLGNGYWAALGVPIIAHAEALAEVEERGFDAFETAKGRVKEKIQDTRITPPTETFEDGKVIEMGDTRIELLHFGGAHSPGDISVWLPDRKLIITGDIAFHQRLLAVFPDTNTADWIESFEKMEELGAEYVIPGHGAPTNMAEIATWTKGYLIFLREEVQKILDAGGGLADAYKIDQSAYSHLNTFQELAGKNAGRVFERMEFENF